MYEYYTILNIELLYFVVNYFSLPLYQFDTKKEITMRD